VSAAVSADWVLPVDGPPIRDGFVAWDGNRITELGSGRADRHYEGGVILPGIVNAHSHLEYAVYAGFGDGEPFGTWLATHIRRKRALAYEHMLDIARRGVADSLAAGITTTADYSFSGAAAAAAAELGLRAIVIGRCLERIGDNAVDIGERTAYLVTAEFREFTDASHPAG
jgi:5-methylthioadenosine/S-adenosylhomocysteine deaminase